MGALRSVAGSNLRPRSIIEWFVWIRSANEIVQRNVVPGPEKPNQPANAIGLIIII
jgi:hypothetical protein